MATSNRMRCANNKAAVEAALAWVDQMCARHLDRPDVDTSVPHAKAKQEVKHEVKQEVKEEIKQEVKEEIATEVLPPAAQPSLEQTEQHHQKKASPFSTFLLFKSCRMARHNLTLKL